MIKKISLGVISFALITGFTGCAHKMLQTPAVMTYDGSSLDYSKIDQLKVSKVCYTWGDDDKDTSVIRAAKQGGISKIKHVDTSVEYKKFLWFEYDQRSCTTVYGE